MSYSQNDEESVICRLLEQTPINERNFLDIGAHDGVTFSNTRALSDRGWGGVLVEPSSRPFVGLMEHYNRRPGILVNVAVVPNNFAGSRLVRWHDSRGDMISTMVESHRADFDHLLFDVGIDYRVEGGELRVLKSGYYGVF